MSNGMSKREKSLVAVALTLLVGIGYYSFGYQKLSDNLQQSREKRDTIESKLAKALDDIDKLDQKKSDLKELFGKTSVKSKGFYPSIIQEKLLLELEDMYTASELQVKSVTWTNLKTQPIEKFTKEETENKGVTLDKIVDQYKKESDPDYKGKSDDQNSSKKSNTQTASSDNAACENISCTISVQSSYDSVKKFIEQIEASGRNIAITNLSLAPINEGTVNGNIVLEFYGLPKIDKDDDGYSNWSYNNDAVYGKNQLFGKGAPDGAYSESLSDDESEAEDFSVVLRSPSSELPTIIAGKANDTSYGSYLYAKNESDNDVTVEINEEGGKLYYRLSIQDQKYPANSSKGMEFTPKGSEIKISVQSQERSGSEDNKDINFNVINNSSKVVNVEITGDDSTSPRIPQHSSDGNGVVNWINE